MVSRGVSTDVVVPLTGSANPAGKFYHPIWGNVKGIFGFSTEISGDEDVKSDVSLVLGFQTQVTVFGNVDIYSVFDRNAVDDGSKRFRLKKISAGKKWLYPLNEYINLGVELVIAEMFLNGSKKWGILPTMHPVLGVEIDF